MEQKVRALLDNIQKRPLIYLGKKSLDRLHMFLCGYIFSLADDKTENPAWNCLSGFQTFVADRYQVTDTLNWSSIIRRSVETEEAAFDTFFELWAEYTG